MPKKINKVITHGPEELAKALELDPADAAEWEMRHSLTHRIGQTVRKSKMTVTTIAKTAGTSRSRITKILKGNSQGISIDVLLRVLGAIGETIKVSYRKSPDVSSLPHFYEARV